MNTKKLFATIACAAFALTLTAQKYVGGDISLLTQYEDHGAKYNDHDGNAISEMLPFFSEQGLNAMRVRLFVDPSKAPSTEIAEGVCQDLDYVKALGKRIKDQGFALMLDFHYSDSWADPVKQYTPAAWEDLTDDELYTKIYDYTKESLQAMVDAGATPDMVQIGNEISYGILWGKRATGSTKYYATGGSSDTVNTRFYNLLKNAAKACREVCPDAKIILHTERVANTKYLTAFYDNMQTAGVDYDVIGLSYYPYYHGYLSQLETALNTLETSYPDKRIMIVETGYYHNWQPDDVTYDYHTTYAISDEGQNAFAEALIEKCAAHDKVDGIFWWFMEANEYGLDWNTQRVTDNWYNAGLFDNSTGKARLALSSLKNFLTLTGIESVKADKTSDNSCIYTIDGRKVAGTACMQQLPAGLYIKNGRKLLVK